ncbi:MAG: HD domain-containing protein [Acutalibacter sp.]|nr:HD domain-containing protein [Acutalibacter sp.]
MESNIVVNRIEKVREYVDDVLLNMTDDVERRCAYVHLYGVAQACTMIAQKRKENAELAVVAGMLHDISSYQTMDRRDHAHRSAAMAKEILEKLGLFTDAEIDTMCDAIYRHSDKAEKHPSLAEVLIDADVFQHCLYNPLIAPAEHEKERFEALKREFGL